MDERQPHLRPHPLRQLTLLRIKFNNLISHAINIFFKCEFINFEHEGAGLFTLRLIKRHNSRYFNFFIVFCSRVAAAFLLGELCFFLLLFFNLWFFVFVNDCFALQRCRLHALKHLDPYSRVRVVFMCTMLMHTRSFHEVILSKVE